MLGGPRTYARLVAKVASDQAKPRGLLWVPAGSEEAFLAPLSVRRIPESGKSPRPLCILLGIETQWDNSAPRRRKSLRC